MKYCAALLRLYDISPEELGVFYCCREKDILIGSGFFNENKQIRHEHFKAVSVF